MAKTKKKSAVDHAINEIGPTLHFAKDNFKDLFFKYLKIWFALYGAVILTVIILGLVTIVPLILLAGDFSKIGTYMSANPIIGPILFTWLIIAYFILFWIQTVFMYTAIPITAEQFKKKYSGIWKTAARIKFPVLGHMLLYILFIVLFSIPMIAILLLSGSSGAGIGFILTYFLLFALLMLFAFFSQFWLWELLISKKGVVESLRRSFTIVVDNFFGVLVFSIVLIGVWSGYYAITTIFTYASMFAIIPFANFMDLWVMIPWILGLTVVSTVLLSFAQVFMLPYTYSFWEKIRKK
jgi:hypothetical protein